MTRHRTILVVQLTRLSTRSSRRLLRAVTVPVLGGLRQCRTPTTSEVATVKSLQLILVMLLVSICLDLRLFDPFACYSIGDDKR